MWYHGSGGRDVKRLGSAGCVEQVDFLFAVGPFLF